MTLLESIAGPRDLKELNAEQLPVLASEIRDLLIETVSRTSGHLGPNLGVVELTIALHRVFDSPADKIVFDTGHQAYVHKLLTGRQAEFGTLRQRGGLSGYPSRAESEHDLVENSHASTGLSYADGLAKAFKLRGETNRTVVAVVGDGALTGGMAWEALNNIAAAKDLRLVMVVNDNGWSYQPTIGGLATHLAAIRVSQRYEHVLEYIKTSLPRAPLLGPPLYETLHGLKKGIKDVLQPQVLFEDLGLKYVGPIDGHDERLVEQALRRAREFGGPVLVHVITRKGFGYPEAEQNEVDCLHQVPAAGAAPGTWSRVFGDEMVAIGARRPDVVAISAAMLHPTGLAPFAEAYPDRVYDVGIAEQHAVTSAAGLAMGGLHPVVAVYATFLNRAFDQLLMDVALHGLPVTFALDRAGVTGPDGASHNGMWDGSILQVVPGLRIAAPRDAIRLAELLNEAVAVSDGPTVVRYPKGTVGGETEAIGKLGGMDVLHRPAGGAAPDVLLAGAGPMAVSLPAGRGPAGRPGHRRDRRRPALGEAGGRGAGGGGGGPPAGRDRRGQRPGRGIRRRGKQAAARRWGGHPRAHVRPAAGVPRTWEAGRDFGRRRAGAPAPRPPDHRGGGPADARTRTPHPVINIRSPLAMTDLNVAVVGSGPSGLYAADALVKQAAKLDPPVTVQVDVIDRLPTPYGLVRYGVAPDHPSIKSIADVLRKVLEHPQVRFLGGVHLGDDVSREDLLASYDAVIYATGAMRDRRMGIDGEDLPGSHAATEFVNWYSGHPDMDTDRFKLDAESVAVIGVGNVAVDVARILVRDPEELARTDVSQPVLEALMASNVREVHVIGRRGPAQAKFTTKELRELGELAGVDIAVPGPEADLATFDDCGEGGKLKESDRRVRGNLAVIDNWAARCPDWSARQLNDRWLNVRFWLRPVRIEGAGRVSGLIVERTRLDENGKLIGTGEFERMDVQMVLRSVGYQSVPLPGVPFDDKTYTVPNEMGRVTGPDGAPQPREYVVGWLKRGPTGVIGTNKSDAADTVKSLLADYAPGQRPDGNGIAQAARDQLAGRAGRPRGDAGQLRRLAAGGTGRDGPGHVAGPGGEGEAPQPGRDRRRLPPAASVTPPAVPAP